MSLLDRNPPLGVSLGAPSSLRLLWSALLAGIVVASPAVAAAQPGEEEETEEPEGDLKREELPPPDPELGDWGAGGEEPEGKFRPSGKTGALKKLEDEEEAERDIVEGPPDLPPAGSLYLDTVLGFGSINAVASPTGSTSIDPVASFLIGASYRIGDTWQIFARFPISTAAIDGPDSSPLTDERARDPDAYKQIATGALEIGVRPQFVLNRDLWLPAWLAISFPTGMGDMFGDSDHRAERAQAVVNQAAAASRGWEDRGLFAYQRVTITPGIGIKWQMPDLGPGRLRLAAETELEIMIRTGGTDPVPPGDPRLGANDVGGKYNDAAVNWVLGAGGNYDLFDEMLSLGLRFWIPVGTSLEAVGSTDAFSTDPGGFGGVVFEPSVGTHISFLDDEAFGLDAKVGGILPAGGELGGGGGLRAAQIYGLRIMAGLFF
jgi:hypothetical protein